MGSARCGARIVTAGYILLLAFTAGVAAAADDSSCSVKGIVTNAITGERLRKAFVRLAPASDSANVRPAVTDDRGRFAFDNVKPGTYSLEAEHAGFIEAQYGEDAGPPVELRIVAGQDLSDLNIKLMPPATISGHVRDEDGDLWTHASINVFRSVWEGGKRQLQGFTSAEVNDAGEFRVEHLPAGRYYLSADPDAHWARRNRIASAPQLQQTWYPGSLDSSAATPLVVLPGQQLTGAEIRMRSGSVFRVRGKVSGLQGVALLPGPRQWMTPGLTITPMPGAGGNSRGGVLKPDGSFEVEGVVPGTFEIRVEQGLMPRMVLGAATVRIVDHDVDDVSLTVQAPHSLKGVVRVEGEDKAVSAGLSVLLDSDLVFGEVTAMARTDGGFEFESVCSGRYRVLLGGAAARKYYVKRLRYGAFESPDAEFSVAAGGDVLEVTLSSRGAVVSGVVKRDGAAGSATPQVALVPDRSDTRLKNYDIHVGTVDQSGGFVVKGPVRPGGYTLYAFDGVPEGVWTDAEFIKEIGSKGVHLKVEERDARTIEVPLIPRAEIAPLLARLGMD